MLSITTVNGGPFGGLPSFLLTLREDEPAPTWSSLSPSLSPYIPPILRFRIGASSGGDPSSLIALIRILQEEGLYVDVEAFVVVEDWMRAANHITLFTRDMREAQAAHSIVFMVLPSRFRPSPRQINLGSTFYWLPSDPPSAEDIASLPTGMRLWFAIKPVALDGETT